MGRQMKRRVLKKKWNREIRDLILSMKRESEYAEGSGLFKSYEVYDGDFSWSDIYFVGTYKGTPRLFNCTIVSAADHYEEYLVSNIVSDEMDKLYPKRYDNQSIEWGDCENSLRSMYRVTHNEDLHKEMDAKEKEILEEVLTRKLPIKSHIEILPDYQYGVGIAVVTEEKSLNREVVIDYVKRIQALNITEELTYLSDKEIFCTKEDHSIVFPARALNV